MREARAAAEQPECTETISVKCPRCQRRVDATPRADYDPPHAVLLVIPCECTQGCKIDGGDYYDAAGNLIDWFEWYQRQAATAKKA